MNPLCLLGHRWAPWVQFQLRAEVRSKRWCARRWCRATEWKKKEGKKMTDRERLLRIQGILSGKEWGPDTLDEIATELRAHGLEVEEVEDEG